MNRINVFRDTQRADMSLRYNLISNRCRAVVAANWEQVDAALDRTRSHHRAQMQALDRLQQQWQNDVSEAKKKLAELAQLAALKQAKAE